MSTWPEEFGGDLIALFASLLCIAAYHMVLHLRAKREPGAVLARLAQVARAAWVEQMLAGEDKALLAVQTLRNSTMAATFLASTAVLLMIGVLTLGGQAQSPDGILHSINFLGSRREELLLLKMLSLLVFLCFAFFSFTSAVRLFNHVNYMIPLGAMHTSKAFSADTIASYLNRAGFYYRLGMRAYYYAVPVMFWLFGPLYLFLSTVALVAVLYHLDTGAAAK